MIFSLRTHPPRPPRACVFAHGSAFLGGWWQQNGNRRPSVRPRGRCTPTPSRGHLWARCRNMHRLGEGVAPGASPEGATERSPGACARGTRPHNHDQAPEGRQRSVMSVVVLFCRPSGARAGKRPGTHGSRRGLHSCAPPGLTPQRAQVCARPSQHLRPTPPARFLYDQSARHPPLRVPGRNSVITHGASPEGAAVVSQGCKSLDTGRPWGKRAPEGRQNVAPGVSPLAPCCCSWRSCRKSRQDACGT